jgi:hypothetical protein
MLKRLRVLRKNPQSFESHLLATGLSSAVSAPLAKLFARQRSFVVDVQTQMLNCEKQ